MLQRNAVIVAAVLFGWILKRAEQATSEQRPRRGEAERPQQPAGQEAEDHRGERRDEAERGVAAAVVDERLLAREEVEEPLVRAAGEVRRLVRAFLAVAIAAAGLLAAVVTPTWNRSAARRSGQPSSTTQRASRRRPVSDNGALR